MDQNVLYIHNNEDYGLEYQNTVMYGRYSKQLEPYIKSELHEREKLIRAQKEKRAHSKRKGKVVRFCGYLWKNTFARLGEDWVFMALLGIITAFISFIIDIGIEVGTNPRFWLHTVLEDYPVLQYIVWLAFTMSFILFSAGFVHVVAPQAAGSGIPEMKTILRGVPLKGYLTWKTLVAKVIGLTATLSSGIPLGKEGPFVHIGSIVATLLGKVITSFKGIYENESRNTEMLATACGVGITACFAAPVGGLLYSIEVTSTYFAVRNYWRGFFAAVCSATVYRLFAVWYEDSDTVTPLFKTYFTMDDPFDLEEILVFAIMGVFLGLAGAAYVRIHRHYVMFIRSSERINTFLGKNVLLYPAIISFVVGTVSFPLFLGQYMATDISTHHQVVDLFSNFSWTSVNMTVEQQDVLKHWTTEYTGIFISLFGFTFFVFIFSIIGSTLPIPSGSFIPALKIGAGFGRLFGEFMFLMYPTGMRFGGKIIPGGYATVGAAAFTAAVTHSISVSVMVFEMTGQITHIIPIMVAVLISNTVAGFLSPSLYESMISLKKLPYLPDIHPGNSESHNIYVEDFMVKDVKYIFGGISYAQLKSLVRQWKNIQSFPLVDHPDSMVLLGSIQRLQLIELLEKQIGRDRRLDVAAKRQIEALEKAREVDEQRQRRPSRFEVIPTGEILQSTSDSQKELHNSATVTSVTDYLPKKSILKKTSSLSLRSFTPFFTNGTSTPNKPTDADTRIQQAFEAIFRKSTQLPDAETSSTQFFNELSVDSSKALIMPINLSASKKVQLPTERICDMSLEDQKIWEEEEMALAVDFTKCHIDPAPFQLVERTSLLKVHTIFSMVGVNHAYVTSIGKLVGVVTLTDIRMALENMHSGHLTSRADRNTAIYDQANKDATTNSVTEPLLT